VVEHLLNRGTSLIRQELTASLSRPLPQNALTRDNAEFRQ